MSYKSPEDRPQRHVDIRTSKVSRKRYFPVLVSMLLGTVLSAALFLQAWQDERSQLEEEFDHAADTQALLIANAIQANTLALESVRSFYCSSKSVERDEFTDFVKPYFGDVASIYAFKWAPLVPHADRKVFEETIGAEGHDVFRITEQTDQGRVVAAGRRNNYFPVIYNAPAEENELGFGCDLAADPSLLAVMERARDSGQITATERLDLPDLINDPDSVYFFVPVYQNGEPIETISQRQTQHRGFVVGIYHVYEHVDSILAEMQYQYIDVQILDKSAPEDKQLLYTNPSHRHNGTTASAHTPGAFRLDHLRRSMKSVVGGREWEIVCTAADDFVSPGRMSQPWIILAFSLSLTLLISGCFHADIGRTLRVERLVEERTQQLRTVNDSLEAQIAESKRIRSQKENLVRLLSVANNDLVESNRKLLRSNRELEEFAYVASHDLQEPLRKITAFGDRLKAKYSEALDETGRDYVERMQSAARRMSILISDMLTYSRVSSKGQAFTEVDLEEITREVLEDLDVRIEELGATVQVDPLPCVRADAAQMRQLMQNLISNALKFHKPDAPPVIKIYSRPADEDATEAAARGSAVAVVIEDNGIGFDEKYTEQIFRMFQRLHSRSAYEGTGVGLAVCRKIATRHGAAITARSISGEGAEFTLTFSCDSILSQPTVTN